MLWLSTNCQNFSDSRSMAPKSYISCRRLCRRKMRRLGGQKMLGEPWDHGRIRRPRRPFGSWRSLGVSELVFESQSFIRLILILGCDLLKVRKSRDFKGLVTGAIRSRGHQSYHRVTTAGGHRAINPKDQPGIWGICTAFCKDLNDIKQFHKLQNVDPNVVCWCLLVPPFCMNPTSLLIYGFLITLDVNSCSEPAWLSK